MEQTRRKSRLHSHSPVRILNVKMLKQSNGDPHDTTNPGQSTDQQRQARLKELAKLTTREKLLRIMKMIGDERVGDDQLLRALIVLEDIEPKNQGG